MYDLAIIGGGPAGMAAGIYAARKKLKGLLITDYFGGQSIVSAEIQNFIGIKSISGFNLAKKLEEHLKVQKDIKIIEGDLVNKIKKTKGGFQVITQKRKVFNSKTILITSGSRRKKLNIYGEKEFEGRGVSDCATCDAPFFKDKNVAVVGGGNAGLETVISLLPYASKIFLIAHGKNLTADCFLQEKLKKNSKVKIITLAKPEKIIGQRGLVSELHYQDCRQKKTKQLKVDGIFVEIGSVPNSELAKDLVALNKLKEIIVDHKTQRTSQEGIWAAGAVTDGLYRQNNIAIGDAIKATLNIHRYLHG